MDLIEFGSNFTGNGSLFDQFATPVARDRVLLAMLGVGQSVRQRAIAAVWRDTGLTGR